MKNQVFNSWEIINEMTRKLIGVSLNTMALVFLKQPEIIGISITYHPERNYISF